MHFLNLATTFAVLLLIGVELSVAAFINPVVWLLDPVPQAKALSLLAIRLGKAMPFWYAICFLLLATQTWLQRHAPALPLLLAATAIWLAVIVTTILVLVPINNRVAASAADWREQHKRWDRLHRIRILVLCIAAALLLHVVVR